MGHETDLLAETRQKLAAYRAQLALMSETAPFEETERFREAWVEPLERLVERLEKENETEAPSNAGPPTDGC